MTELILGSILVLVLLTALLVYLEALDVLDLLQAIIQLAVAIMALLSAALIWSAKRVFQWSRKGAK